MCPTVQETIASLDALDQRLTLIIEVLDEELRVLRDMQQHFQPPPIQSPPFGNAGDGLRGGSDPPPASYYVEPWPPPIQSPPAGGAGGLRWRECDPRPGVVDRDIDIDDGG